VSIRHEKNLEICINGMDRLQADEEILLVSVFNQSKQDSLFSPVPM